MMYKQLDNDQELIRRYLAGQESAFEKLVNKYKDKVFSTIYFTVKDYQLASDIFQDTFIKVIQSLKRGKYNDEGKFLPWVNRIAHNLIIDYFRKQQRIPTLENSDDYDLFNVIGENDRGIDEQLQEYQLNKEIRKMIRLLPKDQREVLMLRVNCNMSFKEISVRTNVSINTALGRMRYAVINLRKMIQESDLIIEK